MRTILRTAPLVLVAVALSLSVLPGNANADTITVSPPKFELFGNPGDTVTEKIKVSNDGATQVTYETEVNDFSASGDQGGININDDPGAPKTNFSLEKWVTIEPSRFTVPAGDSRYINVTIRIPKTGEPGGHYATVQVKLAGEGQVSGGASVESRLNTLLLLRVSGNIDEKLSLQQFSTNQNYYQDGPVNFSLKTKNDGNVHVAPTGTIIISDTFNRKVAEVPLTQANVLPGGERSIATLWEGPKIGRYTATVVADYGQSNKQRLTASTSFIVFPLTLIWILLGGVAAIALLVTQRKGVKRFINKLTAD